MAISSLGIGSGLDLNGILTSLMQLEQQPLVAMQRKELSYQAKISAIGTLKGSLSALQSAANALTPAAGQTAAAKFTFLSSSSSDSSVATASTSTGASSATYKLEDVVLAQAQQLRRAETTLTIPASGTDGTLTIQLGSGTSFDVDVSGGATLSDIATAINQEKADVTASVINDGTTNHLVLSAKNTGASNTISVQGSAGWESFNTPDVSWIEQQEAVSASVKINGLPVTSETNTISSAVQGVSFTLLKGSVAGSTISITENKTNNLTEGLNSFIKAFNTATLTMRELGAYDPATKVAGALQGEGSLRNAQTQVRSLLETSLGGESAIQRLSDLGITTQTDGTLKLDVSKLNKAISDDFDSATKLAEKIGNAFNNGLNNIVGTTGSLNGASQGLDEMVKSLQSRQQALMARVELTRERYTKQFTSLDVMLSNMNQTSNWLTQQLDGLPGAYSGSK